MKLQLLQPLTVILFLFLALRALAQDVGKSTKRPKAGESITNSIGMELLYCPPGRFRMGAPIDAIASKRNEHEVDVEITKPFYLGKYEVTRKEWGTIMDTQPWKNSRFKQQGDKYPVADVRWEHVAEFCDKLSKREGKTYRLPTEAEWEYASRAGAKTQYYFGNKSKIADHAWYAMNTTEIGKRYVQVVGQKKPNPWGFHDVYGNVEELCWDSYAERVRGGRDPRFRSKEKFDHRVMKGGSCNSFSDGCRSAARSPNDVFTARWTIGFRVCLEADPYVRH
jgi:formylglycine-generating enzyme required for sulfatase activity